MRYRALPLIVLLLLTGCDQIASRQAQAPTKNGVPVGRFTIVHSPHIQRDTMLLDTATGETWELVTKDKTPDSELTWVKVEMSDPLPNTNSN